MTDLLPIVFQKGVNESIDGRVAPPDQHQSAINVRWRKDGRPSKRYGSTTITTTGLDAGSGFASCQVNAVANWNQTPLLALGSNVTALINGAWTGKLTSDYGELSHWGPGRRDVVARTELALISNLTTGAASTGLVFHAWDNGTNVYYSVKNRDGSTLRPPTLFAGGTYPRIISTPSNVYIVFRQGTALAMSVFTASGGSTALASPGTLLAGSSTFDTCGRTSDFLLAYQTAAGTVTVKSFSAVAIPILAATQTATVTTAGTLKMGIVGDATNNVFLGTLDGAGHIQVFAWDQALSTSTGSGTVETDANNFSQPGLVLDSAGLTQIVWGGVISASETTYMRTAKVTSAGALSGSVTTFYGVAPSSKPFHGPLHGTIGDTDGSYVWVNTSNVSTTGKWDDQRTYILMKYTGLILHRHMHTPNVAAGFSGTSGHISDVVNLGSGYGFMTPLPNIVRKSSAGVNAIGFDTVTARSIYESIRTAARDWCPAGRVTQFTGGSLAEYGGALEETGFSNFPVIQSITGGGGGSLTVSSTYIYCAVYEYLDLQGRRHRSVPSDPVVFATGANTSATLVIKPLVADSHYGLGFVALHVYRTLAGQGTFHRVTPDVGAPAGLAFAATVSYVDLMADTAATTNEIVYTDGGVVPNTLAPPSTFSCVCNGRVWVGGQLDECVVTASKILVDGEPTQFSDELEFSVFLPTPCTGLASIDGTVVAFSRERIYFITGDGPNDQGIGGFNPPTELPTDVGCIDWRSVVECSGGVFFQSKRGIFLLPRGFNTPIFIGAEVESTLSVFPIVQSATIVSEPSNGLGFLGEITARFCVATTETGTSTRVLTYDMRTGGWSVDNDNSANAYGLCGVWNDTFAITKQSSGVLASLWAEAPGTYVDGANTFISSFLGTGDLRPFGVAGYGGFDSVVLLGEYRGNATVTVNVSTDALNPPDIFVFTVTNADGTDGSVYLDVTPSVRMGSAIKVTVNDSAQGGSGPTEGFLLQALFVEYETIGKTKRLAAARRA